MPEEIDYAARVARGIALMDEKWPHWATEIDLDALDIESSTCCVTAQYAGQKHGHADFGVGMDRLGLDSTAYAKHGFNVEPGAVGDYPTLNYLWRGEIERRRAQGQGAPAEPEASA